MKLLLMLLMPISLAAKDFTVVWEPSATTGVMYRVWMAIGSGSFSVYALTSTTNVQVTLNPGSYSFYVTAITTNESSPSNIYRLPPPAAVVDGVKVSTNAPPATVYAEIESGVVTAPMAVVASSGATGTAVESTVANSGTVSLTLPLTVGTYVVWCRLKATASNKDSVFVAVDGVEDVFGNEAALSPNFQWRQVTGGNGGPVRVFNLLAGQHTITFRGREAQVPLDAIYVTSDLTFTP